MWEMRIEVGDTSEVNEEGASVLPTNNFGLVFFYFVLTHVLQIFL
jgi:hypothetical protein